MLLQQANDLAAAGKLDEAYDYFRFLEENYPNMDGLAAAGEEFLFKQAKAFFSAEQYRNALGVLRELHRRNPQRPKLDTAMGAMTEKLVEQYAAAGDYPSLRACWASCPHVIPSIRWSRNGKRGSKAKRPGNWPTPGPRSRRAIFARRRRQSGAWSTSGRRWRAPRIWPGAIHRRYPRVVVGVCQAASAWSSAAGNGQELLTDWAARRSDRLLCRRLTEFAGAAAGGGTYRCPVGKVLAAEGDRRITVQLRHDSRVAGGRCEPFRL